MKSVNKNTMTHNRLILDEYWVGYRTLAWDKEISGKIADEIRNGLYGDYIHIGCDPGSSCIGLGLIAEAIKMNTNIKGVELYLDFYLDREGYCSLLSAILNHPTIQEVSFGGFMSWSKHRKPSRISEIKLDICRIFRESKGPSVLRLRGYWFDHIVLDDWDWLFPSLEQNIYLQHVNDSFPGSGEPEEVGDLEDTLRRNRMLFWSWSLENALAFPKETRNTNLEKHLRILLLVCLRFPQRPLPDCWTIVFEHARILKWE